jgi:hypothetical protein
MHLLVDPGLIRAVLNHPACAAIDLCDLIRQRAHRHGFDAAPLIRFFQPNPIDLAGEAHRAARARYLEHYREIRQWLRERLPGLANRHFAELISNRPPGGVAALLARGFVDRVLCEVFSSEYPGLVPLYDLLAQRREQLFGYLHHPVALADLSRDLGRAYDRAEEQIGAARFSLVLAYVLQGRDPLIGALGGFSQTLLAARGADRDLLLRTVEPPDLFESTTPVNYIARIATGKILLPTRPQIEAGDLLILATAWAAAKPAPTAADRLACGAGAHQRAGRALALEIAGAWLGGLREAAAAIDWSGLRPERLSGSVFVAWDLLKPPHQEALDGPARSVPR